MSEGEFKKRIDAFERECVKQKFWPEGMRNTVNEAAKAIMTKWENAPINSGDFFVAGSARKLELEKWRDEFHEILAGWFGDVEDSTP